MTEQLHSRLTDVFRKVFKDESLTITRETTAADIAQWDSLTHLDLITETEKGFGIEITGFEVMGLKNAGDLLDLVARKIS